MAQITAIADPLLTVTADFLKDPYPYFHKLRKQGPLVWSDEGKYWLVLDYAEANELLRDLRLGKRISEWSGISPLRRCMEKLLPIGRISRKQMLQQDPPDHTRMRSLVNKAFTPKMVENLRPRIMDISNSLIDQYEPEGKMDLVHDYAFPLPITVIAEMLGIPAADREKFSRWSHNVTGVLEPISNPIDLAKAAGAARLLVEYFRPLIKKRKADPKDDLVSALAAAEEKGDHLSMDELFSNLVLILIAGHETTVNLIGNAMLSLFKFPEQMQLLKEKPELIGQAVDEFLRYDSSVQMVRRLAYEDVAIAGKTIRKGDLVIILTGAANHDPKVFAEPEKFDILRDSGKHLAFGFGIHHCLGSSLAPLEVEIAVGNLLKRLPNLHLTTDKEALEHKRPFALRGVKFMPVAF